MSNFKNMLKDFGKKLGDIKTPEIKTPLHKKKLKRALIQSFYLKKSKGRLLKNLHLFSYFKTMSLKKTLPISLVVLFVLGIFGQNYLAIQNTAYAQKLIDEVTTKMEENPNHTEQEKDLLTTLQILEEMKKTEELQYLGEEIYPANKQFGIPERKIQKFRFTDSDLSRDIVIIFENNQINFQIDAPLGQIMSDQFELQVDENGTITNLEDLKKKLTDPNLLKPWLKELVKKSNQNWLEMMDRLDSHVDQEQNPDLDSAATMKANYFKKSLEIQRKVVDQLKPLAENAEVSFQGFGGGYDPATKTANFSLSFYTISEQKKKDIQAQSQINQGIEKLSKFKTDSAQKKIGILKKALESKDLKRYSTTDAFLSLPYPNAKDHAELYIRMDLQDQSENFIQLSFQSEALSVIPGQRGKWLDIEVKNNSIANIEQIKQELQDPNLHDDLLLFIIQSQNRNLADSIKKYELTDGASPNLTAEIANQLEDLLVNAQIPVIDRNMQPQHSTNKNGFLYSLGLYPLGQLTQSSEGTKMIDGIIEQLKISANGDSEAKIQFLEKAKSAKDLKYEGEKVSANGEKLQKISFSDNERHYLMLFNTEKGDYQIIN